MDSNPWVLFLVESNKWLKNWYLSLPSQAFSIITIDQTCDIRPPLMWYHVVTNHTGVLSCDIIPYWCNMWYQTMTGVICDIKPWLVWYHVLSDYDWCDIMWYQTMSGVISCDIRLWLAWYHVISNHDWWDIMWYQTMTGVISCGIKPWLCDIMWYQTTIGVISCDIRPRLVWHHVTPCDPPLPVRETALPVGQSPNRCSNWSTRWA